MTFANMSKEKLLNVADKFDVEVEEGATNKEIIKALENEKVTFARYKKIFLDSADQEADVEMFRSSTLLVKMERRNPTFEAFGHRFTKEHPFVAMSQSDAQELFDNFEGFRIATPNEAEKYYS